MHSLLLAITLKFILLLRFPTTKSLAGVTLHRYGQDTLDSFRALERSSVKYDKCLIDLEFLRTCRDADLVPVFLQFKLSSRRLRSSSETLRARRRLLAVEINARERDSQRLKEQVAAHRARLKASVRRIDFVYYRPLINSWPTKGESQCSIHLVDEVT